MITFEPLWKTLQEKGVSTYSLINTHHVSSSTISRLRNNKGINTATLDDLCRILKCDVKDILLYTPDNK